MQWTYQVIVKTGATSKVPEAIAELTSAQKASTDAFENVSKMLTNDFSKTMLLAIEEKLKDWQESEEDGSFMQNFQEVFEGLQEIRAGIVTLMDLKEGNFANTINMFRTASKAMEDAGTTIEDAMLSVFKEGNDIGDIQEGVMKNVRKAYDQLSSTIGTPESNTFLLGDEDNVEVTDKFTGGFFTSFDDILQDFPDHLAKQVLEELNQFFNDVSKTSGTEILNEFLGESKDLLKLMQQSMSTFFASAKMANRLIGEPKNDEVEELREIASEGLGMSINNVFGDVWNDLKDAFQEGVFKSIDEKGSDFLKDETTLSAVSALLDNIFETMEDSVITKLGRVERPNTPSLGVGFQSSRKNAVDNELENLTESVRDYMSQGNDPFGVMGIQDKLEDIINKSKTEFADREDRNEKLSDIMLKNFQEANIPDMVKDSLSGFLTSNVEDDSENLLLEMEDFFGAIENELKLLLSLDQLSTSLEGAKEIMDSSNDLSIDSSDDKSSSDDIRNVTIDFDFDKHFQKNVDATFDSHGILYELLLMNHSEMKELWALASNDMQRLMTIVQAIEMPKERAATSSDL